MPHSSSTSTISIPDPTLPPAFSDLLANHHLTLIPSAMTSTLTTPTTSTSTPQKPSLQQALSSARSLLANERKLRVLILSSDTGGGHKASAQALRSALEQTHGIDHIDVQIVDFWVDFAEGPFINFPSQYTFLAKHPLLWKLTYEITRFPPGRAVAESFFSAFGHNNVRDSFSRFAPDLILSVHPLVNTLSMRVIEDLQRRSTYQGARPIPYVTVVTDLAGAHPTWFHPAADMTYIPLEAVSKTALKCGIPHSKLRVFGLPVRPDFWQPPTESKLEIRNKLGLLPDIPTILAVGGGDGVGGLQSIALALASDLPKRLSSLTAINSSSSTTTTTTTTNAPSPSSSPPPVQVVVICGKNEKLRKWLSKNATSWSVPVIALGYVTNMSEWMAAVDIICTKAGPGTMAESLIRGLPIVVTGFLPGQEEANVKMVVDAGVGAFAKKPKHVVDIVSSWISNPSTLVNMSVKAKALSRPHATLDIAKDVVRVTQQRVADDIVSLERTQCAIERRQQIRVPPGFLAPFVPFSEFVGDDDEYDPNRRARGQWKSHLGRRVNIFIRLVIGSLLAHDAIAESRSNRTQRTLPPTSPPPAITQETTENE